MRAILLGLLLLLAACERRGYEISVDGVSAYVPDTDPRCFACAIVHRDVRGADPKTFVQMSADPGFGKDARHAFYEADLIEGARPESFHQLGASKYSADDTAVFFETRRVVEADVASFRAIAGDPHYGLDDYAIDAHNTYLRGAVVPNARGAMTYIKNGYLRDEANQIFHRECNACEVSQVDACDGATLDGGEYLRAPEAWDKLCVYADAKRLPLTDRASYRYLGNRWSKDAGGVYYGNQRMDGADPATFNLFTSNDGGLVYGGDASGRCWLGYVDYRAVSCPANAKRYTDPGVSSASVYAPHR